MSTLKTIALLSCLLALSACKTDRSEALNLIDSSQTIKVTFQKVDYIRLSDFADSVSYLILDSKNEIIGDPFKIVKSQNRFYIGDRSSQAIYVFDDQGAYLFKLAKNGQGPGEYAELSDFEVHKDRKEMHVLSRKDQSLLKYSLDGGFIEKLRLGHFVEGIFEIEDNAYLTYATTNDFVNETPRPSGISVLREGEMNLSNKNLFHFAGNLASYNHGQSIYIYGNENGADVLTVSDSVFSFVNGKLMLSCITDFGSMSVPKELIGLSNSPENTDLIRQGGHIRGKDYWVRNNALVGFTLTDSRYRYWAYSMAGSDIGFYASAIVNDLDGSPTAFPMTSADNTLFAVVPEERVLAILDAMAAQKAELIKNTSEDQYNETIKGLGRFLGANKTMLCQMHLSVPE